MVKSTSILICLMIFMSCATKLSHTPTLADKYRSPSSIGKEINPLYSKVSILCQNKKLDQAIDLLSQNHQQYKKNAAYWNMYFFCYYKNNNLFKAEYFINKAIKLSKSDIYQNNLAMIYVKSENHTLAYKSLKKIVYQTKHIQIKFNFIKTALLLDKNSNIKFNVDGLESKLLSILIALKNNQFKVAYSQISKITDIIAAEKTLLPLYIYLATKTRHIEDLNHFAKNNKININRYDYILKLNNLLIADGIVTDV